MIARKIHLLVLISVLAPGVVYGATATDIVRRSQTADQYVSYRGTKSACIAVGHKTVRSTMSIIHMKPDMTRTRYSSPRALAGVSVIQSGLNVWKYEPRERTWIQVHSAASVPIDMNLEGVFANYDIWEAGSDQVAGRDAYVICARPKRGREAWYRIWIDKVSYLKLRTQIERPSGAVISSCWFTSIETNPKDLSPADFAIAGKAIGVPEAGKVDFRVKRPRYLPKGYKRVGLTKARVSGHLCVHLQFSNGVNTISLFERRADDSPAPRVPEKLTTVITWAKDRMLFTLIGDLPRAELKKIADSTR